VFDETTKGKRREGDKTQKKEKKKKKTPADRKITGEKRTRYEVPVLVGERGEKAIGPNALEEPPCAGKTVK